MHRKSISYTRFITWIVVILTVQIPLDAAEDVDTLCDVLDAAAATWQADVEFRCHFTCRQWGASSKEEALNGRSGIAPDVKEDRISGFFCKSGKTLRMSVDYGRPPLDTTGEATFKKCQNVSLDTVFMNGLSLKYWPRSGSFGDRAVIAKCISNDLKQNGLPGLRTPFSFGGGFDGSPLNSFGHGACQSGIVTKSASRSNPGHTTIVMVLKEPDGRTTTRKVTFWTAVSPAVIERIESSSRNGNRNTECVEVASRFVSCGKAMMASDLRGVSGPIVPVGKTTPVWPAYHWTSEDLGQMPPIDEDFVVAIPPSTFVMGLKSAPPTGTDRRLNLAEYTISDLDPGDTPPLDDEVESPHQTARTVAMVTSIIVLFLGSVYVWLRKRLRARG